MSIQTSRRPTLALNKYTAARGLAATPKKAKAAEIAKRSTRQQEIDAVLRLTDAVLRLAQPQGLAKAGTLKMPVGRLPAGWKEPGLLELLQTKKMARDLKAAGRL